MRLTSPGRPRAARALNALAALTAAAGIVAGAAACSDKATGPAVSNTNRSISVANTSGATVLAALVVFNSDGNPGTTQSVTVTANGIADPVAADRGVASAAGGAAGPLAARATGLTPLLGSDQAPVMNDAPLMRRLRDFSRRTGGTNAPGLRTLYERARASGDFGAWHRPAPLPGAASLLRLRRTLASAPGLTASAGTPSAVGANLAVGDTLLLNVRVPDGAKDDNVGSGNGECGAPNLVKSRVAAISDRAIVAVDTRNPTSGLNDAFYASVATTFDTLVYPTDTRNFGAPIDIDKNGRAILFYTRAVNGLTPPGATTYIGGFFYSRDLRPTTGDNALTKACAGSNAGELFYLLAPDPSGTINTNRRDTAFVRSVTVGTAAHEFQHLINAERRLFVLGTPNYDEDVWLNEGLSHIAEELSFYRSAGLSPAGQPGQSPRARLTAAAINRAGAIPALNGFGYQNLTRFSYYLRAPDQNSPYADNDSLETRGATWSFLRYAADRSGASDSAFFSALVTSNRLGLDNLAAVVAAQGGGSAGVPLATWFRDWAVSNFADGLASNLSPEFTQPSWVFRSVLTQIPLSNGTRINGGIYPLATRTLAAGTPQTVSLAGGAARYYVFSIPAGSTAAVTVAVNGTAASSIRTTLVQASGAVTEAQ